MSELLHFIEKDSATFVNLFLQDSIPWMSILDDQNLAFTRKYLPQQKALQADSYKNFVKYFMNKLIKTEEKFFNIKIENDPVLASITFDYSFFQNDKPTNWGKESWELFKIDGQWKIATVFFSVIFNKVVPVPSHLQ